MATFEYHTLDAQGKAHRGVVEADSAAGARQQLREKGLLIIKVLPAKSSLTRGRYRGKRIKSSDLALMTRQLATLVAASLPVEESLRVVAQQCENSGLAHLLTQVRDNVMEGLSLAEALATFPRTFDRLFCSMVAAGEASGHLSTVLNRLADHAEQSQLLKNRLLQAMIYPLVLTLVAIGVVTLLLTSVVPKVVEQFVQMKQTLPITTRSLMTMSDFLRNQGQWLLLLLAIGALAVYYWLKKPENRLRWHAQILKLPIIGKLSREMNTARYARTLSILNSSAVPLLESMRTGAGVLDNQYARQQLLLAVERVREGSALHLALQESKLFSPMMRHMIASGESSGELDTMLDRAAEMQERAFNNQITLALSLFEPLLIITMAGIVLFIVLAILQPILQLNTMVG